MMAVSQLKANKTFNDKFNSFVSLFLFLLEIKIWHPEQIFVVKGGRNGNNNNYEYDNYKFLAHC